MKKKLTRRNFLLGTAGATTGIALTGLDGTTPLADVDPKTGQMRGKIPVRPPTLIVENKAELPPKRGLRAVVVGGGWGGLTIAKHLKRRVPEMEVVLIEQRSLFMSCPISNLWLAGLVDFDFITHSFVDAARNNNYIFFHGTVLDVDRDKRIVYTEKGYMDYDYLILSPGIDYDYGAIGVHDVQERDALMKRYPAAFKPGSEHITLKQKVDSFEKGLFVLTVPSGNYRCLPAPYERTCMIASVFKRKKIPAKVLLLDHNHDIKIKGVGFHNAFNELYKDYVEYVPSVSLVKVDVEGKSVSDEFDEYKFDDAAIYPRIRAHGLIEHLGLVQDASPQMEARIDMHRNNIHDDRHVYVIGDARSTGWSKSGSTAQAEARYVARVIANRIRGIEIPWESPDTTCYSMVGAEPMEAIYFGSKYLPPQSAGTAMDNERFRDYWIDTGAAFAWRDRNMSRSPEMGDEMIGWALTHYAEMFESAEMFPTNEENESS